MSSNSSKPVKMHRHIPEPVYQEVPTTPGLPTNPGLNLVTTFDRHTPKSDTTTLLDKNKDTNCNCCSPFRPRRKKLSKSGKKVGKKSNKKSGKVRKNKRKTRL